ncbi:MAG: hypothetical protein EBT26_00910 [Microbacteriaceae bacterium]|nr:hypothetical protein [Microbacteriaceae bacterium]
MNKITVLFPGGFKPLTGAHLALAQRYAESPQVDRVILLIGPNSRDGFTREKTIEIFDLIQSNGDISDKIEIQPTQHNSPIVAAYEYLFDLPSDATGRYAMAASTKGDDYVRAKTFVPNVDKYATIGDKTGRKIPAGIDATELSIDVDPETYADGTPISATAVRQAIAKQDYETFRASYPQFKDAIVKNAWQIVTGVSESLFTKNWWTKNLQEDVTDVIEAIMNTSERSRHDKKIKKLRNYLDSHRDQSFTYDFNKFPKTVYGARLMEGGAAGHMAHPWDDHGLTFSDMKEIVSRALEGRLDIEQAVTEKTDGQNIQVTWKNGQIGFARNKGTVVNPMSVQELQDKFGGRGPISDAFGNAAEDLAEAFGQISQDQLDQIFKNGRVFANMEIIYPATRNVIAYEVAVLQFHNLIEYDEQGNQIETDLTGGATLQKIIQDANAHLQKTFSFIPPQQIKIGRISDFEDQQAAFFNEIAQLQNRYGLKDTDRVTEYHRAWWRDVIKTQASKMGYEIPENVLNALIYRWAFFDKSESMTSLKKQIANPEFLNWVMEFDKNEFKQYYKQNMEPFETLFLRLGAVALKNAENFLAANPSKTIQQIKSELAELIQELQNNPNPATISKLELELKRIDRLGGFDAIVPSEGVVFTYGGNTYKLTGAFAPVNQILGVLKYAR